MSNREFDETAKQARGRFGADMASRAQALRGAGLSGQKVGYLRDLCARIADGRLRLDELEALPDEAVIERLSR